MPPASILSPRPRSAPGTGACAALILLLAACTGGEKVPRDAAGGRVILFGVDGADWQVIEPLMARGRMPNFARVVREGSSGILLSMEPSASPSLWTTIATGVGPERHGIEGFVVENGEGGGPRAPSGAHDGDEGGSGGAVRPVTSGMRKVPAAWNILSRYGRRAGIVGWLVTWPAEPINGFIVSSYLPYIYNWSTGRPLKGTLVEGIPRQTFPEGLIDELEPLKVRPSELETPTVRRFYNPDRVGGLSPSDRECVTGFLWSLACDETYRRIGRHLFTAYPVDLFAVYFGGVDVASHRFWKFAHPEAMDYGVRPADAAILGGVIDSYYAYIDEILGDYLASLRKEDTLVILSDHGFKPVLWPGHPATSGHHRLEGIVALFGRGVRPGIRIEGARLVDILPTVLMLLDVPLAGSLEGRPLTDAFTVGFQKDHPLSRVKDYSDIPSAPGPDTSDLDHNVLERLRSLGYIN